jgi:hypothetical protein
MDNLCNVFLQLGYISHRFFKHAAKTLSIIAMAEIILFDRKEIDPPLPPPPPGTILLLLI